MEEPFEVLFKKNEYKPFEYKGKIVSLADTFNVPIGKTKFVIKFEQVNSLWEQGIMIHSNEDTFSVNENECRSGFYLWQSASLSETEFIVKSSTGEFKVWNIWRLNNKPMQYGHNGAALYIEEIPNGKRYYCNDGSPDDDFDDLVFTIEKVQE
ncbi:MAG: hypothetical protein LW701_11990 [Fluviicola sp.]|jgi:hypothetical protein|nr:hypothetical protein [Fluviicola sp.]